MVKRSKIVDQIVETSNKPIKRENSKINKSHLLPTGSTLLNLAGSDSRHGAMIPGHLYNFIGDSSSGKTLVSLNCLAEANIKPFFDDYDFHYDDVERGCGFDIGMMFSESLEKRLQVHHSDTIEQWQDNMTEVVAEGKPFIYILDSYDALDSEEAEKQREAEKKARDKGNVVNGSYGMAKTKKTHALFRDIVDSLDEMNSILIIISQTKDNINPMSFKKKTRNAENALEFFSSQCIWFAMAGKEPSKNRIIGTKTKAKYDKNRLTGKRREAQFSIFNEDGIDDLSSCIEFLLEEKWWNTRKLTILATEFDIEATKAKLIQHIEENNLEDKLRKITEKCWVQIEESLKRNRKKRYA